jgi:FtsP/CotA-like multicopper oxidase with cupredoxin domain
MHGTSSPTQPIGADGGDVPYALHLVNGRPPTDPDVVQAKPGQRVRLRIINAAADAAYRVAVGGHRMTVTHADGFACVPVEVDALVIGMGERYDVVITAGSGVFPIAVVRESKADPPARALLRTGPGATPAVGARPAELDGRLLSYADVLPAAGTALPAARPDTTLRYALGMRDGYVWTINGRVHADQVPERVRRGERVRLAFINDSSMFHPMHLHGHSFALTASGGRKDTVIVAPRQTVTVDVQADNPGRWMIHCHNAFHLESGMATSLDYVQ